MMKLQLKILAILTLFSSLTINQAFGQNTKIKEFYSLFSEIEFDVLHVYSFARHPATFQETSTYSFKGIEVDTSFYVLLIDVLSPIGLNVRSSRFYATYRFYITSTLEALLIREFHDGGQEHHIHYLVYDNVKDKLTQEFKLSYAYGYEGSFGAMESWILDLNKDGQKDILTRSWSQSFIGSNAYEIYQDSVITSIWLENELSSIGIMDTLLKKQLAVDFPYYKKNSLSYTTEQQLSGYLKKRANIQVSNDQLGNWCIVACSDKDLSSAKYEIERARKIIGINQKYDLDSRQFEINKKNNRYYTVIPRFKTETEAKVALIEIHKRFNKTAYVINFENWCEKAEYQTGDYYKCAN